MNLFNLFLLLNSVIVLILGGAVYFSGKRHLLNKIWGMLSLALFFWSFGHYKAMASLFEFDSLIWFRIANLALVFLPMLFLHLILIFLEDTHSLKRILPVSYASGLAIFITALLAPASFVKEVTPALSFHYYPVGGWLYKVFILGFSLIASYGFCKLFKRFWGAVEFRRNQARYLFIGWLFGIAGVASFFPLSLGVPVYPLGNYFIIVFALSTSSACILISAA